MNTQKLRAGATLAVVLAGTAAVPLSADAQSRSSYNQWRTYYQRSSEGSINEREFDRATSRNSFSSATRRAIDRLDDDRVDELPIPILLGFSISQLSKNYGDPRDGGDRTHEGLDLLAAEGAYVVSPTDAVVTRVGEGSSAGKYVYTANPGGETFAYMHLADVADGLRAGDVLEPGELIGYVGNTGNAAGGPAHLHFEIRDGRTPTDPYPRLTKEFTLEERVEALAQIAEDADDDAVARDIAVTHAALIQVAVQTGTELPEIFEDYIGTAPTMTLPAGQPQLFVRDLTLGSTGDDVRALQEYLISYRTGASAEALLATGATGYFGPLTQAALAEFQAQSGISPAAGYFGPLTRARMLAAL